MPADDGDPVEGVHRDGEPADRRELIGRQLLAGAGPFAFPVVVFGQLRDGLGEGQGCLLHRGEQVDVPPRREDGEALRVSPFFTAWRTCRSRQKPQPLSWETRMFTSSTSSRSRPA